MLIKISGHIGWNRFWLGHNPHANVWDEISISECSYNLLAEKHKYDAQGFLCALWHYGNAAREIEKEAKKIEDYNKLIEAGRCQNV